MKIVSLNTWGKEGPYQDRWAWFLKELQLIEPNILSLQEIGDSELTNLICKTLPLKHAFHSYEAGLLILSQFPFSYTEILKYKTFSLLENYPRHAIIAGIKINNREITFANTHLSWKKDDSHTRFKQTGELLKLVKQKKLPAVFTGDFNDTWDSLSLKEVRKEGFYNLIDFIHPNQKHTTWDNQNHFIQSHNVRFPDRQIDYILFHESLLKSVQAKTCEVIFNKKNDKNVYASDHYGMMADFEFK